MDIEKYDFNYNISIKTMNCINAIDFTYHISNRDYPVEHLHTDYFEFTILTDGSIDNIAGGKKVKLEAGNLLVTLSNVVHSFKNKSDEMYFINIICRNSVLDEFSKFFGYDLHNLFRNKTVFKLPEHLVYRVKSNIDFVNTLDATEWEKCNSLLKTTIIDLVNFIYLDSLKSNYNGEKWEIMMNYLIQSGDFYTYNVNQLCESLGYSRTQLNRIFMEKYGMTPHDYLVDQKMKYALTLVCYTDFTISQISKMVGYANANQFNKIFKERHSKLPQEYRKKS